MRAGLTLSRFGFLRSEIILAAVVAVASMTFLLKPKSLEAQKLTSGSTNSLPMAKPEEVGFSAERLQRVTDAMQKHIDSGAIAGVTTLIAHNGKIAYFNAQGMADIDTKRAMQKDDIFNWASATKPITATAILMLVEQGKVGLNDPVWKYLPEFKNQKVNVIGELVPVSHDITVRDC
jgi:CubicO group peptidase (beta-lactamase class C family)